MMEFDFIEDSREPVSPNTNITNNKSNETQTEFSNEKTMVRDEIKNYIVYPSVKEDVKKYIDNINYYEKLELILISFKYVSLLLAPVFGFASILSPENIVVFNFIGSSLGSLGIGFDRLASFCQKIAIKSKDKLNILLEEFDINIKKEVIEITNKQDK